jgi:hypothetical protein
LTRAQLLERGLAVVVGTAIPGFAVASAQAASRQVRGGLQRARFAPYLGTTFLLARPQGGYERAELVEIGDLDTAGKSDAAFSLIFHGRRPGALSQGTITFFHDALGALRLFQVPVFTAGRGQDYQVIVDRRRRRP